MEKISLLIGKPVLNIYNSKIEGYVLSALFNKKMDKLKWIIFFDDNSQEEKMIATKNIYKFGENALLVKNSQNFLLASTLQDDCVNILGYTIFDLNGKKIDKIKDIEFDTKCNCSAIYQSNNNILQKQDILSIGDNILIKRENKNIKLSNFKPSIKIGIAKQDETIKVQIQADTQAIKPASSPIPKKILTSNYNFLIGRKLGKNVYSDAGDLIAKTNTKITNQIIDSASKNGKLRDLTVSSVS